MQVRVSSDTGAPVAALVAPRPELLLTLDAVLGGAETGQGGLRVPRQAAKFGTTTRNLPDRLLLPGPYACPASPHVLESLGHVARLVIGGLPGAGML